MVLVPKSDIIRLMSTLKQMLAPYPSLINVDPPLKVPTISLTFNLSIQLEEAYVFLKL